MNYKQVIKDFNNGTIDKNKWQLVMDNDDGYWSYIGDDNGVWTLFTKDLMALKDFYVMEVEE